VVVVDNDDEVVDIQQQRLQLLPIDDRQLPQHEDLDDNRDVVAVDNVGLLVLMMMMMVIQPMEMQYHPI
jgi:hypothetical protein